MKINFTALIAAMSIIASCSDKHEAVASFDSLPQKGWAYGDTLTLRPDGLDSVRPRNLSIAVRHSNSYPYRNLWIEVTTRTANLQRRDTINIELADIYGRWHGNGFGPSYQYETRLKGLMPIGDTTIVAIRHIMRIDTLKGIEQVGITVTTPPLHTAP